MSGGIAYVLDTDGTFGRRCNRDMVDLEPLIEPDDLDFVHVAIVKHLTVTGSHHAERLLGRWADVQRQMIKVMPRDYKRALAEQAKRRFEASHTIDRLTVRHSLSRAASKPERGAAPVRRDARLHNYRRGVYSINEHDEVSAECPQPGPTNRKGPRHLDRVEPFRTTVPVSGG
jgi:hypothetical protein